ncbi:hypothetical protein B224_p00008 (plasmid) [Aeromonas media WS]|nr:hypothetical protein B224_p00008 [Aeromonas media WS]
MRVWLVGQNGESSHTAQRATRTIAAHGSQPWGSSNSGTGSHPRHHLKNARQSGPQAGTEAGAARRGVSQERVRESGSQSSR